MRKQFSISIPYCGQYWNIVAIFSSWHNIDLWLRSLQCKPTHTLDITSSWSDVEKWWCLIWYRNHAPQDVRWKAISWNSNTCGEKKNLNFEFRNSNDTYCYKTECFRSNRWNAKNTALGFRAHFHMRPKNTFFCLISNICMSFFFIFVFSCFNIVIQ